MRRIVRGLSIGYLLAATAFGGALIEHSLLSAHTAKAARAHSGISKSSASTKLPLRGAQDIHAPLLVPTQPPEAPRKPVRKRPSSRTQFAGAPLLDTSASAG